MAIQKIEKNLWKDYFNEFTKKYLKDEQPEYAEISILSESLGNLTESNWLVLQGMTYDPREDTFEIFVESLDHRISSPSEIYVDEDETGWLTSMEIIRRDGTKDIIELR